MASTAPSGNADVSITKEQLTKYFHLPITDVAKELGICATMLKKICRKNGIPRWPHRKIKSINKMIESLEASLPNDESEAGECIRQEIIILKNKKSLIMRNPSILGNTKRAADADDQAAPKKQRIDPLQQTPVTTFTNPKATLSSTTPNSFSINQLLTPSSTSSSPSALLGSTEEKDYRVFAHHPHLLASLPFSDSRGVNDSKLVDGRTISGATFSPSLSYLPEDDVGRHPDGTPLLHHPSTDPYFYHKIAPFAPYHSLYPPRQMLSPPAYLPPHGLATSPHSRNPYYHPYNIVSHEPPRQHLINDQSNDQSSNQSLEQQEQHERTQQQPHGGSNGQGGPTQQQMSSIHSHKAQQQAQSSRGMPQSLVGLSGDSLLKMNIPTSSSDMHKCRNPPSPSTHQSPYLQSGADVGYYFTQYHPQSQRLHPQ